MINSMKPGADPAEVPAFRQPRQPLTAFELWQLHKERRELRQAYFEHWNGTSGISGTGRPVDALLAPVMPYTSVPHGMTGYVRVSFQLSDRLDTEILKRLILSLSQACNVYTGLQHPRLSFDGLTHNEGRPCCGYEATTT